MKINNITNCKVVDAFFTENEDNFDCSIEGHVTSSRRKCSIKDHCSIHAQVFSLATVRLSLEASR